MDTIREKGITALSKFEIRMNTNWLPIQPNLAVQQGDIIIVYQQVHTEVNRGKTISKQ